MALTRRQREIYDYISEFVNEQGYSPSLEEIMLTPCRTNRWKRYIP